MDSEFLVEMHAMRLHGAARQKQLLFDMRRISPLSNEHGYLRFARSELIPPSKNRTPLLERRASLQGDETNQRIGVFLGKYDRISHSHRQTGNEYGDAASPASSTC